MSAGIPVPTGEYVRHDFAEDEKEDKEKSAKEAKEGEESEPKDSEEKANGSAAPEGTRLEIKRLDEIYDRTRSEWTKKDTVERKSKDKDGAYAEFAFTVVRKFNPTQEPTLHIITTTYDIRSIHLRKIGKDVIGQVQGISWTAKPLKVDPQIFVAFLPKLIDHLKELREKQSALPNEPTSPDDDNAVAIEHLDFLVEFLKSEHDKQLEEINALLSHGEITFDLAWALFVPRTILYTACPVSGSPRAVRLIQAEKSSRPGGPNGAQQFWRLDVEYMEYRPNSSGSDCFGLASLQNIEVPKFNGAVKITSLPSFPLTFYPGVEELTSRLVERGKKWCTLQGVHHKYYNGTGFHFKDGKYIKLNTDSRIMVDWNTFQQIIPNYQFPIVTKTLSGEDVDRHIRVRHADNNFNSSHATDAEDDVQHPAWQNISDEDQLLASPLVYGFSLADKLWLELMVDEVQPFTWNDEPFTNLVLARDQKTLILSLVEAHTHGLSQGFDDFVKGKGQGLVINLFGNPGVGKSLTAEATSEHVRKPLYVVGAGDLGTNSATLDMNLTRIFTISSRWGAVVLIDEADVFLEERSFANLERNAMVAVFLRQLEYFRGILFLTTNRVRTFDEAFQSRIHVALRYHDLTADAKRQIWLAFLKKARAGSPFLVLPDEPMDEKVRKAAEQAPDCGLRREELHELGEKKVNGRQIKNVVRTATALATSHKELIGYKHLIQVLDMMEQFDATNAMYQ
ncbi:P-loop containing nucleoside triphosphate hydrolase protein [Schizopora paradoxa]|uniref:p-loop containing nucleoside triphosphate hydrolase protein n=1 Tax=Schizopora paradoxa TaxID=27342 RepID=A0A0H2S0B7_9AGAM|nr:P-loop containing nucleoside triphosphate hydrolase protein [Schizopora paradoxa]